MADSRSSSAPIHWSNFSNFAINLRDLSFVKATTYKWLLTSSVYHLHF
jgi:hypothetical protein